MNESPPAHTRPPISALTWGIAASSAVLLVTGLRVITTAEIPAVLVIALTTALLDHYPVYLDPAGELPLTPVITVATVVLFGWAPTLLGAAAGMTIGFLRRPARDVLANGGDQLLALSAGAIVAYVAPPTGTNVSDVILAGAAYAMARLVLSAARLHIEESITWPRAIRFQVTATTFHMAAFTGAAAVAVWAVSNSPSLANRLLVPPLAATLTLQLYLPRILRGQEQRRALAAVSVLAAAVDARDPYTADHSAAVAELSRRVARILGLDEPEVHRVYLTGLLHDVGKTVIPLEVLLKPGKLTNEEWRIMQSHVEAGVRIVESISGLAEIAPLVAGSHENFNGTGYPSKIAGDQIPLSSRINLVVDAYNALTTNRPYRAARSSDAAIQELEAHAGTQFDPRVVAAFRAALGYARAGRRDRSVADERGAPGPSARRKPSWVALFREPAFALLWTGQLVSFLGDEIFFIALTLWVYQLTGSATVLALTLITATVGQGLLGLLAGALADRMDRRGLMIASDLGRAALVAVLPFVLLRSLPAGFVVLIVLNVGTVFFRSAVYGLIPAVVPEDILPTGTALLQTTERVAEIIGGVLGGAIVLTLGYHTVFYLDALSFVFSAVCVGLMPVAWRVGLATTAPKHLITEIGEGLAYIRNTPLHLVLALLIVPGYLTLAFPALRAPMIIKAAGLPIVAYGVINSVIGVGKLVSAVTLASTGRRWVNIPFVMATFLLTGVAVALFGATTAYPALIVAAFFFGAGNIATNIANVAISLANAPSWIVGRLMASRQVFIAGTTLLGMLVFGRLADVAGPQVSVVMLGVISVLGVLIVWIVAGRDLPSPLPSPPVPRAPGEPTAVADRADAPADPAAARPP
ncbi:MAG TPA: MFS transporter [bacterium]|nr:MFS transporter [bacterium]